MQLRLWEMQFHDKDGVVTQDSLEKQLLRDGAVTLFLDTQKNCFQGELNTMEATDPEHGNPVSAAARRFTHLKNGANPDSPIYTY